MDAIQCDRCGEVVRPDTSVGWFQVERVGIRFSMDRDGPFHFDSPKCLTEWALETAGVREA